MSAGSLFLEKLPKRVWGEPRNVTDALPPGIEAPVTRPPSPKRAGLRLVWLVLAILVRLLGYVMRASGQFGWYGGIFTPSRTGTCRAVTQKGRTIKLHDKISLIHIPGMLF